MSTRAKSSGSGFDQPIRSQAVGGEVALTMITASAIREAWRCLCRIFTTVMQGNPPSAEFAEKLRLIQSLSFDGFAERDFGAV